MKSGTWVKNASLHKLKNAVRAGLCVAVVAGSLTACGDQAGEQSKTAAPSTDASIAPKPCATAPREKATALLLKLFPDAEIKAMDPLALDDSKTLCMLEVEMLADKTKPGTRGFVYVFPDGERFLNGPLMDKRSDVGLEPPAELAAQIAAEKAKQAQLYNKASAAGVTLPGAPNSESKPSDGFDTSAPVPSTDSDLIESADQSAIQMSPVSQPPSLPQKQTPDQVKAQQEQFLADLKQLPDIVTGKGARDVYVMFEPSCPYCRRLYGEHEALAERYNLKFHWIPFFSSEKMWQTTAFLLKTYKEKPSDGPELFRKMMTLSWDPLTDAVELNKMKDPDYHVPLAASLKFKEAATTNPVLGTPLVVFRAPDNSVEVISGIPRPDDWKVFGQTEVALPAK
jgi:hypothetical protein